eukprot:NODE_66_length_23959_cov_0.323009.p4 type:complete len:390 gc:universal NODE_66_length_23959_cov_0.323009:8861-10030(+)
MLYFLILLFSVLLEMKTNYEVELKEWISQLQTLLNGETPVDEKNDNIMRFLKNNKNPFLACINDIEEEVPVQTLNSIELVKNARELDFVRHFLDNYTNIGMSKLKELFENEEKYSLEYLNTLLPYFELYRTSNSDFDLNKGDLKSSAVFLKVLKIYGVKFGSLDSNSNLGGIKKITTEIISNTQRITNIYARKFIAFLAKKACKYSYSKAAGNTCRVFQELSAPVTGKTWDFFLMEDLSLEKELYYQDILDQIRNNKIPLNYIFAKRMDKRFEKFERSKQQQSNKWYIRFKLLCSLDDIDLLAFLGMHAYYKDPKYFLIKGDAVSEDYQKLLTAAIKDQDKYGIAIVYKLFDHHYRDVIISNRKLSAKTKHESDWYDKLSNLENKPKKP